MVRDESCINQILLFYPVVIVMLEPVGTKICAKIYGMAKSAIVDRSNESGYL